MIGHGPPCMSWPRQCAAYDVTLGRALLAPGTRRAIGSAAVDGCCPARLDAWSMVRWLAILLVALGSSGPVMAANVDFSLQNAMTMRSAAQYVRFNQVFLEGDLPQGQSLSAVIGTKTAPLQLDVLSRYANGSVKLAILTIAAPEIAAGATLRGTLITSSA